MAQGGAKNYLPVGFSTNRWMLLLALKYRDPVLAWHYYSNPSPTRNAGNTTDEARWNTTPSSYSEWTDFLGWGEVAPQHPADAKWPLTAFWPDAGAFVMRKSWYKNARVAPAGAERGVVWGRAGPLGSKSRMTVGVVHYEAEDVVVLGAGPADQGGAATYFGTDPSITNSLFVDGEGQANIRSVDLSRLIHGKTVQLGDDTFLMDMSPQSRPDFYSMYQALSSYPIYWTRKVFYNRALNILWIKDVSRAKDTNTHQFRLNWNTSSPGKVTDDEYSLPGDYRIVGRPLISGQNLICEVKEWRSGYDQIIEVIKKDPAQASVYPHPEEYIYKTIVAGTDGPQSRIVWAVGKSSAQLREFLTANQGAFILNPSALRLPDGSIQVTLGTDELSDARATVGSKTTLWTTGPSLSHSLKISSSDSGNRSSIVIEVRDAYGDISRRSLELSDAGRPLAPRDLRVRSQ